MVVFSSRFEFGLSSMVIFYLLEVGEGSLPCRGYVTLDLIWEP